MGQVASCCNCNEPSSKSPSYIDTQDAQPAVMMPPPIVSAEEDDRPAAPPVVTPAPETKPTADATREVDLTASSESLKSFEDRLAVDGQPTIVVLHGGKEVTCTLKLRKEDNTLLISTAVKHREVPLNSLKGVLYGSQHLKKVEIDAQLDEETCCALYLREGACIPLRMQSTLEKDNLVAFIRHKVAQIKAAQDPADAHKE